MTGPQSASTPDDFPRQARAWHAHLDQDAEWIPVTGVPTPIADMDAAWRHNAANWLLKRAKDLQLFYSFGEILFLSDPIGREVLGFDGAGGPVHGDLVVPEVPLEVERELGHEQVGRAAAPEAWLKTTDLYQALVKDLPENVAELAKHWSDCELRTGQGDTCSCWKRHVVECPIAVTRDATSPCHCGDISPDWADG